MMLNNIYNKPNIKPILLLTFFLSLTLISTVQISSLACVVTTANNCQGANQNIVMRLSGVANSHGEYNSEANYANVLCCDFGADSTVCSQTLDPVTGQSENKIIGLSSSTNAHGESPVLLNPAYDTTNLCYAGTNLCRDTTDNCATGEVEIITISAEQNAHIGTGYGNKVCCTPVAAAACDLISASWTTTERVAGQTAYLYVETTDGCNGQEISFEVWERDTSSSDDAVTVTPQNAVVENNVAIGTWTAEWREEGIGETDPPEYYFIATATSTGEFRESSNELRVLSTRPEWCQTVPSCGSYTTQANCTADLCGVSSNSVPLNIDCSSAGTECFCTWDALLGQCGGSWRSTALDGTCSYVEQTTDTCDDDGILNVNLDATWTASDGTVITTDFGECKDTQQYLTCPANIPLSFFNIYNLIATIIIILLIYWMFGKKRKSSGRKKKR